jgi:SAM-dependent methyltransferase
MSDVDWTRISKIFQCPHSRKSLTVLSSSEVEIINRQIANGHRTHHDGSPVKAAPLSLAIATPDRRYIYFIEQDIALLLPALAIVSADETHSVENDVKDKAVIDKKRIVMDFYNQFGWLKNNEGYYNDTATFTCTRLVAQRYAERCNERIAAQLRGGTYILDAASGAIPHPSYHQNYEFRICVDFSIQALREVQKNLPKAKAICVLGDLTSLPIADSVIDDVISLHTIYHIPDVLQNAAVEELVRILKPGGRTIIVYSWDWSPLMDAIHRASAFVRKFKRSLFRTASQDPEKITFSIPPLYYCAKGRDWFRSLQIKYGAELRLWSSTSGLFNDIFFRENGLGRFLAQLVFLAESVAEPLAAWYGQYPMFVIAKKNSTELGDCIVEPISHWTQFKASRRGG